MKRSSPTGLASVSVWLGLWGASCGTFVRSRIKYTHTHTHTVKNILLLIIKVFAAHATPFEMLTFNSRSSSDFDSDWGDQTTRLRRTVALCSTAISPELELELKLIPSSKSTCWSNENWQFSVALHEKLVWILSVLIWFRFLVSLELPPRKWKVLLLLLLLPKRH